MTEPHTDEVGSSHGEDALERLAEIVAAERNVLAGAVRRPGDSPILGLLAAAGPRASGRPGDYALLIETIREGYLLHYGVPRVVVCDDPDLSLLAGDYLYALGLERLAGIGDLEAVAELADLVSISAQLHAGSPEVESGQTAAALWMASTVAVATGPSQAHADAKQAARSERPEAGAALWEAAREAASRAGLDNPLTLAAESIGFRPLKDHRG